MSFEYRLIKKLYSHRYILGASILILFAAILRMTLVLLGWTMTNSDEAITDLAALHIEKNGEHPIFFYGQHYLGQFAAYIGSVLFRVFGPSVLVMRLEMITFTTLFLICLYFLTSRLYTKGLTLLVLALLCFGSQWTIHSQIQADGYPEVPFFTVLLFFAAYIVVSSYHQLSVSKRCALYFLWGLLAGLAFWIQFLIAPYILVSGLMIIVLCWPEFFKRSIWLILLGFVIGATPLLYYNLTAAPGQDSYHTFLALSQMGVDPSKGLFSHIQGGIFFSLPISTGYVSSCVLNKTTPQLFNGPHQLRCMLVSGTWGISYVILLLIGLVLAGLALRKAYQLDKSTERHQEITQQFTRLMLLCGAGLSIVFLIRGNAVNISPTESQRYLICTWVSLPAVLWPLWICDRWSKPLWLRASALALKLWVLFLVGVTLLYGTILIFQQGVPAAQADRHNIATLEEKLEQLHITRFYSTYWMCGRVIFDTQEQLICGDTQNDLSHGFDRYLPYRTMVEADPHLAFVYPDGSPQIDTLHRYITMYHLKYDYFEVSGYVIYKMHGKIPLLHL